VSLSSDGNTLAAGGYGDNSNIGATWIFVRIGTMWSRQGNKLVGSGSVPSSSGGYVFQGYSVALSSDGDTLAVGGRNDGTNTGATWIFVRTGNVWSQQGNKLVGGGATGATLQGESVALSSDGDTLAMGGSSATWVGGVMSVCSPCSASWYCPGNRTAAIPCAYGDYCPAASSTNNPCNAGSYCPSSSTNVPCPVGRYNALSHQTLPSACLVCPPTHFCPEGADATVVCPIGYYCRTPYELTACPTGRWSNRTGLLSESECMNCTAGRYSGSMGATSSSTCLPCVAGTSCPTGSGIPEPCRPGSFSATDVTKCSLCPSGRWQSQTGQSACVECTPGTFNGALGKASPTDCVFCAPGRYQNQYGASNCSVCAAGTWSPPAALTCTQCAAGMYQNRTESVSCDQCAEGTYSSAVGATSSLSCTPCPLTAPSSPAGSISVLQCRVPSKKKGQEEEREVSSTLARIIRSQ
jgi:hypothetical protein